MRFEGPLIRGRLLKRYKRFLADVELETERVVTAHCCNPGSMQTVAEPGSEVWLSLSAKPNRQLAYSWELIRVGDALVGINTSRPNAIVAEAIREGQLEAFPNVKSIKREVRYGTGSRIDLLVEATDGRRCLVEIKNVTMRRGAEPNSPVEFPDSVTHRGAKHLRELSAAARAGDRATMIYLTQRDDAPSVCFAADIDPEYVNELQRAIEAGVEIMCYRCHVSPLEIDIAGTIPWSLP